MEGNGSKPHAERVRGINGFEQIFFVLTIILWHKGNVSRTGGEYAEG